MLSFLDKMRSVILKSKAVALHRWIYYHSCAIKSEMSYQFYLKNGGKRILTKSWLCLVEYSTQSLYKK
jgi:hypothetical protein